MIDNNIKKRNFAKRVMSIIASIISITISQIITNNCLGGSLGWTLTIMIMKLTLIWLMKLME